MPVTSPLLSTKLMPPPLTSGVVPRPHLMAHLNEMRPLTILSAPPGFGKTTLLLDWLRQLVNIPDRVAPSISWLSLDDDDNDPVRFWSYVITALQSGAPNVGASALVAQQSSPTPNITTVVTLLINDLATVSQAQLLILDDYHVIEQRAIHTSFNFLLEHLPANLRLILATRTDPPLPLARWRTRNQLTELGQADLRFTPLESAEFLNQLMNLQLTADDIATLEQHTEGWIAGLQLAALSLSERTDRAAFIRSLSGTHAYIADYFIEEILNHQAEAVQTFLMQTSLLDQMCAALCDALTGRQDSQAILEQLQRHNLFMLPLDNERAWYRYHPLFGEMLRARLTQLPAVDIPRLHGRAAAWYEQQHLNAEAIDHVLAAGDFEHAAHLIEEAALDRILRGETYGLLDWLQALPATTLEQRPRLQILLALTLMSIGEAQAALIQLDRVNEQVLTVEERALAAAVRTGLAPYYGEIQRAADFAQQALTLVEQAQTGHVAPSNYLPVVTLLVTSVWAEVQAQLGQLAEAIRATQRALQLVNVGHLPAHGVALAGAQFVEVGQWLYEQNDLTAAEDNLLQGLELSRQAHNTEVEAYALMALARVHQVQRQSEQAERHTQRAIELIRQRNVPLEIAYVMVQAARLWLQQGKLAAALEWAALAVPQLDAKHDESLTPTEMAEAILLARVRLAAGHPIEAANRLARLQSSAEAADWVDALIGILILQALIAWLNGRRSAALETLQRALAYAEPGGYVRRFIDEGALMQTMLTKFVEARRHGHLSAKPRVSLDYVGRLLTAFEATTPQPAVMAPLIEPLNDRELEILRLIAANRSNQEIAQELFLSLSTVKWHITNLYGKLQVRNRLEAVNRARELDLL
ncbi:HTH-type transcriptional regulator MalT [Thermoflexales bacterium]|nr:HTH-type transcriptional regulator MalT [Thermoflexales bacterium]